MSREYSTVAVEVTPPFFEGLMMAFSMHVIAIRMFSVFFINPYDSRGSKREKKWNSEWRKGYYCGITSPIQHNIQNSIRLTPEQKEVAYAFAIEVVAFQERKITKLQNYFDSFAEGEDVYFAGLFAGVMKKSREDKGLVSVALSTNPHQRRTKDYIDWAMGMEDGSARDVAEQLRRCGAEQYIPRLAGLI